LEGILRLDIVQSKDILVQAEKKIPDGSIIPWSRDRIQPKRVKKTLIHSFLGYMSPAQFEAKYCGKNDNDRSI
jgi:hypothetical protein